jgi:hypothetical protein
MLASLIALVIGSAINSVQAASKEETGRWCIINARDNVRHCYFQRHRDCQKAISDGDGICVPNEKTRGEMLEDSSK